MFTLFGLIAEVIKLPIGLQWFAAVSIFICLAVIFTSYRLYVVNVDTVLPFISGRFLEVHDKPQRSITSNRSLARLTLWPHLSPAPPTHRSQPQPSFLEVHLGFFWPGFLPLPSRVERPGIELEQLKSYQAIQPNCANLCNHTRSSNSTPLAYSHTW